MPGASRRSAKTDPLRDLLEGLASEKPAPAGGSAAAAVIAVACALLEKCARLSVKQWSGAAEARSLAVRLRQRSEELAAMDVRAYLAFVAARRSRRGVEQARNATIDIPLEMIRVAVDALDLAHELARHGNQNLRPDATTAAILAHASISAAAMMVQVNLNVEVRDPRLDEALELMRGASASVRRLGALSLAGGRDRAPARPAGSRRR